MSEWHVIASEGNPKLSGEYWVSLENSRTFRQYYNTEQRRWNITDVVIAWQGIDIPEPYVPPVEEKPLLCPFCGESQLKLPVKLPEARLCKYQHPENDCVESGVYLYDDDVIKWNKRTVVWSPALGEKLREWHAEWVKILPFGDSISSIDCYANRFLDWLEDAQP